MTFVSIGALLLGGGILLAQAGKDEKMTDASRAKYLKDFKRVGMNTPAEDALLLRILIEGRKARRALEVGTANGYGAIHMGIGLERTGGKLVTVDIDPKMVKEAREHVAAVGMDKTITVVEGDALKVLPGLEGEFDFAFLDALKSDYLKYYRAIEGKLKPGAIVVAHNAVSAAASMKDFLDFMGGDNGWEMVVVRTGTDRRDGMAVCYKVR
jgi:predicted O-methyltransferase YrrM